MSVPRYKHDCMVVGQEWPETGEMIGVTDDACRFIGCLREWDLYIHERDWGVHRHVECVARCSDDGPGYLSGESAKRLILEFLGNP